MYDMAASVMISIVIFLIAEVVLPKGKSKVSKKRISARAFTSKFTQIVSKHLATLSPDEQDRRIRAARRRATRSRGVSSAMREADDMQVWKEGPTYVAYALELDVSSCGRTPSQAKSRLREAIALFVEESAKLKTP
ncbi:MAG TPA: hypothetical protein VKT50_13730 [Candidatus Acidoferrales bacterium]|nr:hypothetical protein [Candidatus Acidoferrales bacterium]